MGYLRPTYQEAFFTLKVVCSNWHHLVGTYNNGVWSIYVDGVLESSYASLSPGTFAGFSHPIYIGRSASGFNAVGRMKEVSLWHYAKPPSQIQAEFKTKYTGNETGLEGYWKLDVSGSTALDLSPNNRTMTAYSVIWNTHNDFTRTFSADKKSHSDYYPFGMQMLGRTGTPSEYSYGFQGMEHLDGANGFGNEYTTEYRQYDPRLGRWTSVDPLAHEFPGMSPYVAFNNNPILYTDPDGQAAINWCNVGYAIKQGASFVANNAGAFMASQAIEMGMMGNGGVDFGEPKINPAGGSFGVKNGQMTNVEYFTGGRVSGTKTGNKYYAASGSVKSFYNEGEKYSARYNTRTGEFSGYYNSCGEVAETYLSIAYEITDIEFSIWNREHTGVFQHSTEEERENSPGKAFMKDLSNELLNLLLVGSIDNAIATSNDPSATASEIVEAWIPVILTTKGGRVSSKRIAPSKLKVGDRIDLDNFESKKGYYIEKERAKNSGNGGHGGHRHPDGGSAWKLKKGNKNVFSLDENGKIIKDYR